MALELEGLVPAQRRPVVVGGDDAFELTVPLSLPKLIVAVRLGTLDLGGAARTGRGQPGRRAPDRLQGAPGGSPRLVSPRPVTVRRIPSPSLTEVSPPLAAFHRPATTSVEDDARVVLEVLSEGQITEKAQFLLDRLVR